MADEQNAVRQGNEGQHELGYGKPPVEHQWPKGTSGNPAGCPKRRSNVWVYYTEYLNMTAEPQAAIDPSKLTGAQEMALRLVERPEEHAKHGRGGPWRQRSDGKPDPHPCDGTETRDRTLPIACDVA